MGPFLATCTPATSNPYLNYAIPDDEGAPTGDDVGALIGWYLSRDRAPRLEYVTDAAPAVEPALLAAGFGVDGRLPLMTCEATRAGRPPEPAGVELVVPESDDGLLAMMLVQAEAYGSPAPTVEDGRRRGASRAHRRACHQPARGGSLSGAPRGVGRQVRRRQRPHVRPTWSAPTAISTGRSPATRPRPRPRRSRCWPERTSG